MNYFDDFNYLPSRWRQEDERDKTVLKILAVGVAILFILGVYISGVIWGFPVQL